MKFPTMKEFSVKALIALAEQHSFDLEYIEMIVQLISTKISILPAYQLCTIVNSTDQRILQMAALEALCCHNVEQELIELHSFKKVVSKMNCEQLFQILPCDKNSPVGRIIDEKILTILDSYGYPIKEEDKEYSLRKN